MGLAEPTSDNESHDTFVVGTRLFGSDNDNSSVSSFRLSSAIDKDEDSMMMVSPPRNGQNRLPTQRLFGGDDDSRPELPVSPPLRNINPYTNISSYTKSREGRAGTSPSSSAGDGEETVAMSEDETEVVLTSPLPVCPPSTVKKKGKLNRSDLSASSPFSSSKSSNPITRTVTREQQDNQADRHLGDNVANELFRSNSSGMIVPPPPSSHRRKKPSGYRPTGREDVARDGIFGVHSSEFDSDSDEEDFFNSPYLSPTNRKCNHRRHKAQHQRSLTADSILQMFGKENIPPPLSPNANGTYNAKMIGSSSSFDLHDSNNIHPLHSSAMKTTKSSRKDRLKAFAMQRDAITNRGLFMDDESSSSSMTDKKSKSHDKGEQHRNESSTNSFYRGLNTLAENIEGNTIKKDRDETGEQHSNGDGGDKSFYRGLNAPNTPAIRNEINKTTEQGNSSINGNSFYRGLGKAEKKNEIGKSPGCAPKSGRYSFTGSPIEEIDEHVYLAAMSSNNNTAGRYNGGHNGMGLKARRLNLGPDDATLTLDCHTSNLEYDKSITKQDDVSPTDVFSFPSSGVPPPPTRGTFTRNPSIEGRQAITPRGDAPPETPLVERRANRRRRQFIANHRPRHHFGSDYDSDEDDGAAFAGSDEDNGNDIFGTARKDNRRHRRKHSGERQKPRLSESRFAHDFEIVSQIGTGSFGSVHKCLSRLDGCLYAVKVAKRKAKGVADRDRMLKEVYALAAISDQADTAAFHIVRYHQAWIEDDRLHIQTELCTSTLSEVMAKGMLGEKRRYKVLREILLALELIHKNDMVHLDIKPENIFIKNDQFKLGDFGLVSKTTNHDVEEGDSRYMSMELLSGDHKDLTKCDIFSLGATMYEVCLGRFLPSNGQEWQDIRSGALAPMRETPLEMQRIVQEMIQPNAEFRPSATMLLKRRQLLSEEQQQLLVEKNKVTEANLALAAEKERLRKLTPPRRSKLTRANTWNGTMGF